MRATRVSPSQLSLVTDRRFRGPVHQRAPSSPWSVSIQSIKSQRVAQTHQLGMGLGRGVAGQSARFSGVSTRDNNGATSQQERTGGCCD